jgi:hypothetical protein
MSPEIYLLVTRIGLLFIVSIGFLFFLFLAGFLGFIIFHAIRHPGKAECHPWAVLARTNNLSFRPSPLGYLDDGSQIIGDYRGCDLKLAIRSNRYGEDTILEVMVSNPDNNLEFTN